MSFNKLLASMVVFGATAAFTASTLAQGHKDGAVDRPEQKRALEAECKVKSIIELKEAEDGKSVEVYSEAGELLSRLTAAQLAGLNGKSRRFLLTDDDCMSASDQALLGLIEANPVDQEQVEKPEEKKDSLAEFLVYIGSSGAIDGLKFYEFDQERRSHQKAIDFCVTKGLRLMSLDEAKDLEKELEADKSKLEKWLGGKRYTYTWTSSVSSGDPVDAQGFGAYEDGYVSVYYYGRDDGFYVRCVGR